MSDLAALILFADSQGHEPFPIYRGTDEHRDSCAWAKAYGINPMRVPAGSIIVADTEACSITYERIVDDEDGKPLVQNCELVTEIVVEQLEGPPLPLGHPLTLSPKEAR